MTLHLISQHTSVSVTHEPCSPQTIVTSAAAAILAQPDLVLIFMPRVINEECKKMTGLRYVFSFVVAALIGFTMGCIAFLVDAGIEVCDWVVIVSSNCMYPVQQGSVERRGYIKQSYNPLAMFAHIHRLTTYTIKVC